MANEWELTDEDIRGCKAQELIIYREEDIAAHPPDRSIAKAQVKKLMEWIDRNMHGHTEDFGGQEVIGFYPDEWQTLKKEAGL